MDRRTALQTIGVLTLESCLLNEGVIIPKNASSSSFKVDPEDITFIKQGGFPLLHPTYRGVEIERNDQHGNITFLKKLYSESYEGRKAKDLVSKAFDNVKVKTPENLMDYFRKLISKDAGLGRTSLEHEVFGDSTQTLDEFINNNWTGDCDDFSMALQTCYYLARQKSQGKLRTAFEHYQVIGLVENMHTKKGHMYNGLIRYTTDFSTCTLTPIEPQNYKKTNTLSNKIVVTEKDLFREEKTRHAPTIITVGTIINWLVNEKVNYYKE